MTQIVSISATTASYAAEAYKAIQPKNNAALQLDETNRVRRRKPATEISAVAEPDMPRVVASANLAALLLDMPNPHHFPDTDKAISDYEANEADAP